MPQLKRRMMMMVMRAVDSVGCISFSVRPLLVSCIFLKRMMIVHPDSLFDYFILLGESFKRKKGKIYDIFVIDFPNDCTYVKECLA